MQSPSASESSHISTSSNSSNSSTRSLDILGRDIRDCLRKVDKLHAKCIRELAENKHNVAQITLQQASQTSALCDQKIETFNILSGHQQELSQIQALLNHHEQLAQVHRLMLENRLAEQARDIAALQAAVAALQADRDPCASSSSRKRVRDEDVLGASGLSSPRRHGAFRQALDFMAGKVSSTVFRGLDVIIHTAAARAGYPMTPGTQPSRAFQTWLHLFMSEATNYMVDAVTKGACLAVDHPSAATSLVFAMMVYRCIDPKSLVVGPYLKFIVKEIFRAILVKTIPEPFSTMLYYAPM